MTSPHPTSASGTESGRGELDLSRLWSLLADNFKLIGGVATGLSMCVLVITLMSTMRFRTSGRLYLGELSGAATSAANQELDLSGETQGDVGSEVEILKSRSLISRAISASGLNASLTPKGSRSPRFWSWLLSRRDPKLLDLTHDYVLIRGAAIDGAREPLKAEVRFVSEGAYEVRLPDDSVVRGTLGKELHEGSFQLTLLAGKAGPPEAGAEYDLVIQPLNDVIESVLESLSVTVPKAAAGAEPVKVVTAEFTSTSPVAAASFLKALMQAYLEERQAWKIENAAAAESFVAHQLKGMHDSLENTERKLADYRSNTRVVVLDSEAKAMIEQIGKYEEQRVAAKLEIAFLADLRKMLANPKAGVEAFFAGESGDPILQDLANSLSKAQRELTDLEGRFSAAAPDVRQQRTQVASQLAMIRNYVGNRLARAQENLASLDQVISKFEDRLKTVPGAELRLAQLTREADVYSRMYSYLLERQQQAAIVKASTVSKNRILDEPTVSYREDAPKLGLRIVSCLLSLLLGLLVVLVRDAVSPTFQTTTDVENFLGRPALASIPWNGAGTRRKGMPRRAPYDVLAAAKNAGGAGYLEAFRMLRTNVYHAASGATGHVILMTSPVPGDGKTSCALALAAILAADRKRVLVVDADLRKPSHHTITGREQEPGLCEILTGECDWRTAVRAVWLTLGSFHTVSTGRPAAAELLSEQRLEIFVRAARTEYDYVIFDAASFPLVADALVLAQLSDLVVSVVRLRNTPRKTTLEHVRVIQEHARAHAVVVNSSGPKVGLRAGGVYPKTDAAPDSGLPARVGLAHGTDTRESTVEPAA